MFWGGIPAGLQTLIHFKHDYVFLTHARVGEGARELWLAASGEVWVVPLRIQVPHLAFVTFPRGRGGGGGGGGRGGRTLLQ